MIPAPTSRRARWLVLLLAAPLTLSFSAASLIHPVGVTPPPDLSHRVKLPPPVFQVVDRACRDCHSEETHWPWYSHLAPVSWMVSADVEKGRRFLNFTRWELYSKPQKMAYLASIAGAATSSAMPPRAYAAMHPEARLTAQERQVLAQWAQLEYRRVRE